MKKFLFLLLETCGYSTMDIVKIITKTLSYRSKPHIDNESLSLRFSFNTNDINTLFNSIANISVITDMFYTVKELTNVFKVNIYINKHMDLTLYIHKKYNSNSIVKINLTNIDMCKNTYFNTTILLFEAINSNLIKNTFIKFEKIGFRFKIKNKKEAIYI